MITITFTVLLEYSDLFDFNDSGKYFSGTTFLAFTSIFLRLINVNYG